MGSVCARPKGEPDVGIPTAVSPSGGGSIRSPTSGLVGPHRPPAGVIAPAGRRSSFSQRDGIMPGGANVESLKASRRAQAMHTLAAAAKAAGLEDDIENDTTLHSLKNSRSTKGQMGQTGATRGVTGLPGKKKPTSNTSATEEIITTHTTVTLTATTTAVKRKAAPVRKGGVGKAQPEGVDLTTSGESVAPSKSISNMFVDGERSSPPTSKGKRGSLNNNGDLVLTHSRTSPSPPSTERVVQKKPIIVVSSSSTLSPTNQPQPSPKESPKSLNTTDRAASLAEEKARLQSLLKDMQTKTDSWISSLETKQSAENHEAELAALQAHRQSVQANRQQSKSERTASMDRKVTALVEDKFQSFQTAVESDKLVANLRTDMERNQKRMAADEQKRMQRMESKSNPTRVEDELPTFDHQLSSSTASSNTSNTTLTSPSHTQAGRPKIDTSSGGHSNQVITPFTPQAKSKASDALISPSNTTSALSTSGVLLSPQTPFKSPAGAGGHHGHMASTTPSHASLSLTPMRMDQSVDFENERDHAALTMAMHSASGSSGGSNFTTPLASQGSHGPFSSGAGHHPARFASISESATSVTGTSAMRAGRSPSRSMKDEPLDPEEAASRKALAEYNALRRAQGDGAGGDISPAPGSAGLSRSPGARSHSTLPNLSNSGLPAAPAPKLTLKSSISNASSIAAAPELGSPMSVKKTDIAALQDELNAGSSLDAAAKGKMLEMRASELADGHAKSVLTSQSRICYQVAEVKRLEETTAKRKEELFAEQDRMRAFIVNAKESRDVLLQNHQKRRTGEKAEPMPVTASS